TYLWAQTTAGLFLTGWLVRACGWAAVPKGAAPKPEKDANGEWLKVAEKDKVRLSALSGAVGERATSTQQTESEAPKKLSLATQSEPDSEIDDDRPVFDDPEAPVFADEDEGL